MDHLLYPKHADMEIQRSQKMCCCKEHEDQLFAKIIHNTFKLLSFPSVFPKQSL